MTTPANYSINWNATMSGAATAISAGELVLYTAAGYVAATATNRTGGLRTSGIALTAASAATPAFGVQTGGFIEAASSTLGAGAASWVRASTTGALERCTPSGSDDIVGWCEADGSVHLTFGVFTAASISGGGSPAGSNGDLQMNAGGAFTASHINDNGSSISFGLPLGMQGNFISLGGGPLPASGMMRFDNASAVIGMYFRDAANTIDTPVWTTDTGSNLTIGQNLTLSAQALNTTVGASSQVILAIGGTAHVVCGGNGFTGLWQPVHLVDGPVQTTNVFGNGAILVSAGGLPYWTDNAGFVHQLADYRVCLNANFTSAASVSLQATNLSFTVVAGDVWEVEFEGWTSQASGTAGAAFGLIASGGAAFTQEGVVMGSSSALTAYTAAEMTASGTGYGVFNTVAATKGTVRGRTTITVTAGGTITLGVKPLAAVVSTLYAGFSIVPKRTKKV